MPSKTRYAALVTSAKKKGDMEDNERISIPIRDMEPDPGPAHPTEETTVSFKRISDRIPLQVKTEKGEVVAQISGYGIEVGFNYKFFKNQEDVVNVSGAIATLISKLIVEATLNAAQQLREE